MKAKLIFLPVMMVMMTSCIVSRDMDSHVSASVYSSIPLAPEVVLTVETPVYTAPGPDYVWIDGYWTWDARYREYVWVKSRWEPVPYVGAYWIPGYWDYAGDGYRWIDACWLPRDYRISYGYCAGRYDYYGRPVYYHSPGTVAGSGFVYGYDHRQSSRGRGYSSSRYFNDEPRETRASETREFYRTSESSRRTAVTNRTSQNDIRIREENSSRSSSGSRSGSSAGGSSVSRSGNAGGSSTGSSSRSSSDSRSSGNSGSQSVSRSSEPVNSNAGSSSRSSSDSRSSGNSGSQSVSRSSEPANSNTSGSSRSVSSGGSSSRSSQGGGRR